MIPSVVRSGLGYALLIPDVATELRSGAPVRSRGEISAELTVSCGLPAITSQTGHLFRGRFNFSSMTARASLAKHLNAKTAGLIDWAELLETLCVGVLTGEARGNETVRIGRLPAQIGPAYRVDPLLPLNKPTILFGDGGVGKSYLSLAMAVSCETGREVVPGFSPRVCHAMYLDWETDAAEIDSRIKTISAGAEMPEPEILYRGVAGPLVGQFESIAADIEAEGIGLVIIDSAGLAMGVASEASDANESAIRFYTALRHITAVTWLVIDHVSKEGARSEDGAHRPYGSAYKGFLARSVWELRKGAESEGDRTHLGLYHRKANTSKQHAPIGLAYVHEDGLVYWEAESITEPTLEAGLTQGSRIYASLRRGLKTDEEIAEDTGIGLPSVRVQLSRGRAKGTYAKSDGTKRWGIVVNASA